MTPIIFPYKLGSKSAKALAQALHTKCVRKNGTYKYKNHHLIVNWGASAAPLTWNKHGIKVLNHWSKVAISHNKLTALNKLKAQHVNTVEFTTDMNLAKTWINDGHIVMCRTQLTNHSGFGIVVAQNVNQLVHAPLYTKYVKGSEYRIHVFKRNNEYVIFDIQQKRKQTDFDGDISPLIRSHHRGYVFCRDNIDCPNLVKTEAIKALQALELDFGGVDIKYNKYHNKAYVLEVNSSVGMEGQTLANYTNEILHLCQNPQ